MCLFHKASSGCGFNFSSGCAMNGGSIPRTCCARRSGAMCRPRNGSSGCCRRERMPESIRIEIYSRPGCHLCDEAKAVIEPFSKRYSLELKVTNVDSDADLRALYGTEIPVILINGTEAFRHRVEAGAF